MQVIYSLYWEPSDMVYIGKTTSIKTRIAEHNKDGLAGTHYNDKIQHQYKLYGIPTVTQLEVCEDAEVFKREQHWIREFDSINSGLNIQNTGSNHAVNVRSIACNTNIEIDSTIKCKAILIDEKNQPHYVNNVADFCRTNSLLCSTWESSSRDINRVIKGERKSHKNFRLYNPEGTIAVLNKCYSLINTETGSIVENITNLAEFCRQEPALSDNWYNAANSLRMLAAGRRKKPIKGFTCKYS